MFFEPRLILAQQSRAGTEYLEALSWELGWDSILCHRPGQAPQTLLPFPNHGTIYACLPRLLNQLLQTALRFLHERCHWTAVSFAATQAFACLSFTRLLVRSGCGSHRVFRQRHWRTKHDLLNRNIERRVGPKWNWTLTAEHQHWVHKSPVSVGGTTASIYNSTLYSNCATLITVPLNTTPWYFVFTFSPSPFVPSGGE